ncbi:MAG: DUF554 domain-containing protein [Christensenellales bacterium]|jgi:uncharacterized membrane protein YqgA involved in biofilm formation
MLGVAVNFFAVVLGGMVGTALRGGIPERYRALIQQGLALCVTVIGIAGAIATKNMLLVIVSTVIGAIIGTRIGIEAGVERLGAWAQDRFRKGGFAEGFVNATLLFSIGSMAVVGSLNAGFGDSDTLIAKAAIDGVSAVIIASTYGIGAAFAAVPMTAYQGAIALLAGVVRPYMTEDMIGEMGAIGSLIIIALGLNMLGLTRIKVANLLPAMFIPCVYYPLASIIRF